MIPAANPLTGSGTAPDITTGPDRITSFSQHGTPGTIRSFPPESCALINLRLLET